MEKNLDQWHEIADLINKDKKKALDDFRAHEWVLNDQPVRESMPLFCRRPVMRLMISAVAASMLLVAGLIFFWMFYGSWQKVPAVPELDNLLADSFLYGSIHEFKEVASQSRVASSFSPVFSAWAAVTELKRAVAPAVEPVDTSAPVEHGDPEKVRLKIEKMIRENTFQRLITRLTESYKEV